ncbi:hypothetical protein [Comamonas serinivorans]|nr:hypothetical protein [Comamonas serinivorans]
MSQKKFVPYKGDVPKPQGWGQEISEQEFQEWIGNVSGTEIQR